MRDPADRPRTAAQVAAEDEPWLFGVIATADEELDQADRDLRNREVRWPLVPSIAVIVALSAGLWLTILTLLAHLTGHA